MARIFEDITFQFDPLTLHYDIEARGGSIKQTYDAAEGTYVPNRMLVPLTLVPVVKASDPQGAIAIGTQELLNVRWYEKEVAVSNLIRNNSLYAIADDGTLTVKKNIPVLTTLPLICLATIQDKRTGKGVETEMHIVLSTTPTNGENRRPFLQLDRGKSWIYNPFEGMEPRSVTATMFIGDKPATGVTYLWKAVEDGVEHVVSDEDCLYYVSGIGTNKLTVDPQYIDKLRIICEATSGGKTARAETTMIRQFPPYWTKVDVMTGKTVRAETGMVKARLLVSTKDKIITELNRFFDITWRSIPLRAGATPVVRGSGEEMTMSAGEVMRQMGTATRLEADVAERQPLMALCDENGAILTTENDEILVV